MDNQESEVEEIVKQMQALPETVRNGICWLIQHIELADTLCQGEEFREREVEYYMNCARESNDPVLLALVLYKIAKDNHDI